MAPSASFYTIGYEGVTVDAFIARLVSAGVRHVADIRALAFPILRHRIITNFYAESERVDSDGIVTRLLEAVPVPRSAL